MHLMYLLNQAWTWIAGTGLNLAIIVVLALLVPRAGRLIEGFITRDVESKGDKEETKNTLAFTGVIIYIGQIIAFFLLSIAFLQQIGFSLAGAAIPATVASAAIGFGAQSIIADFLAGFFILTEKQFGVGDWVRFVGNGIEVEGTVIQVTMRATQIRTLNQETIVIPNSTARVSINTSNFWSRAVIVMPVPLLGSESAGEAAERSEAATRRALADESINSDLIGELDVQPAVNVNPPSTVGMPWTVDMRFMIQVEAGTQWAVERAVRMAILDEFWEEYGSATTVSGEVSNTVRTAAGTTATGLTIPGTPEAAASTSQQPTEIMPVAPAEPEQAATAETKKAQPAEGSTPPADRAEPDGSDPAALASAGGASDADSQPRGDDTEQMATVDGEEENTEEEAADDRWAPLKKALSLNGRIRPSTMVLMLLLVVLLVLRSLTVTGETIDGERVSGPLAPRTGPVSSEVVEPEEDPGTEVPIPATQQAPTPTATPTTNFTPAPEDSTDTPAPATTGGSEPAPRMQQTQPAQPTTSATTVPNTATTAPAPEQGADNQGAPAQESPTAGALN